MKEYKLELPPDLPKGLCHLDYDKDNTLAMDDHVSAVLDFDDLAIAPFVVCLAYTLWDIYVEAGEIAVKDYLEHYERFRVLSPVEHECIRPIMLFRHYVVTSIKVLHGHTLADEASHYVNIENELR